MKCNYRIVEVVDGIGVKYIPEYKRLFFWNNVYKYAMSNNISLCPKIHEDKNNKICWCRDFKTAEEVINIIKTHKEGDVVIHYY